MNRSHGGMEQLLYVLSLGFSGSDAARAVVLVLMGALFVTKRFPPWRMVLLLLLIDLAWPYAGMLRGGSGLREIEFAIRAVFVHWQDALAGFLVRAAGFYIFVRGTFSLRRKLHEAFPEEKKAGALPF